MKKSFSLLIFCTFYLSYAQSLEKVVYDKENNTPVIFGSVITQNNYGVITNQEGVFKLNIQNLSEEDIITISSLGYTEKKLSISNAKQLDTIFLKIQQQMLDEVVVSNQKLSARQIIQLFKDNLDNNHSLQPSKHRIFSRYKETYTPVETSMELDRSSFMSKANRKKFNKKVEDYFNSIKERTSVSFSDALVDAFYLQDSTKVNFIKSTYLINKDNDKSMESIQEEVFKELFEALDTKSSFKVRTGIIPVEDSLSANEFIQENESNKKDTIKNKTYKSKFPEILRKSQELGKLEFFEDSNKYEFTLENTSYFNGEIVYVISFEPKRSSVKYRGTAYINAEDYGLLKLDYQLLKGEKEAGINLKFLLGLKFRVDRSSFQYLFKKNENSKYLPYLYKAKAHNYIYFDRGFVFKENTNSNDKLKFKLSLLVESNSISEKEFLIINSADINTSTNYGFEKDGYIFRDYLDNYDPSLWEEYDVLQATKEIKEYNK